MSKSKNLSLLYTPSGRAGEYANKGYACNLYTGCPHGCKYCYSPATLRMTREQFHSCVKPKKNCLERLEVDLAKVGKLDEPIFLCFSCDPYPMGYDCSTTRAAIRLIKLSGNHVRILTKNGGYAKQDFDLLGSGDEFGVTLTMLARQQYKWEPLAGTIYSRLSAITTARHLNIKTWVSFEPVIYPDQTLHTIEHLAGCIDVIKIGKLNYINALPANLRAEVEHIDWRQFAIDASQLCERLGINYMLKADLKAYLKPGDLLEASDD